MEQMKSPASSVSMRDRLGLRLREHRPTILVEVSLVILLKLFAALASVSFLLLGSLSLWLRRSGWRMIGMRKPASWRRAVLAGAFEAFAIGAVCSCLYLASKRNLWLPIVFHGASNTFGLLLIYFDLYR